MPGTYDFGVFHLDATEHLLLREGRPVALPPKAFDLLVDLVEHAGHLREKKQLMEALWPDTFVEEVNLAYTVSALRKALGDTREHAEFIETVPTKGYRFVGKVVRHEPTTALGSEPQAPGLPAAPAPERPSVRRRPSWVVAGLLVLAAIGAVAFVALRRVAAPADVSSALVARSLTRLTFDAGLQTDVTWSPDGSSIAFAGDTVGNLDIWVQRLDGSQRIQITRSPAHDRYPSWSPDGTTLAFRSDRDNGGIFVVPAAGGPERQLTTFGTLPEWSPDGTQLLLAATERLTGQVTPTLYTLGSGDAAPRQVSARWLAALDSIGDVRDWHWHPDGRLSILASTVDGRAAVYTSAPGGDAVSVTRLDDVVSGAMGFRWGRDARWLFLECWDDGVVNLWRVPVDSARMKASGAERLTAGDARITGVAPSRDGRLAFAMGRRIVSLWAFGYDAETGQVTGRGAQITPPDVTPQAWDMSPDGRRVVYDSTMTGGGTPQLWVVDIDNHSTRRLTNDGQPRGAPQFSADGTRFAYVWHHTLPSGAIEQALAVRALDADEERVISTPLLKEDYNRVFPYDWTPDGSGVLGGLRSTPGSSMALAVWPVSVLPDAARVPRILIVEPAFNLWEGQFSPDGHWIACTAVDRLPNGTQRSHAVIAIMPAQGAASSEWRRIDLSDWVDKPRWSPAGDMLFFVRRQGAVYNLWRAPFVSATGAVGRPVQVTHFDSPRFQVLPDLIGAEVGVARDRVVLTMAELTGSIWAIDNADR